MRLIEGDRVTTQQVINSSASVALVPMAAVGAISETILLTLLKIGHPFRSRSNAVLQKSFYHFMIILGHHKQTIHTINMNHFC